ncbi:MAG: DNA primase small subunit domain-containing protein [Nitrososphaeraceae archaeon]
MNEKNSKNVNILKKTFKEYYFSYFNLLELPEKINKREFGFMSFDDIINRHISFNNMGELNVYLLKNIPSDIYCSNAVYEFPTFPINEKQLLGAELIFDMDLKDFNLPCQNDHSYYICKRCNNVYHDVSTICSSCKEKTSLTIIPCYKCNYALKLEIKKLISYLVEDFGINKNNVNIYFSGNTGFHVHVVDENYFTLDAKGRSDLVGYLLGKDLLVESLGVRASKFGYNIRIPISGLTFGWRKRILTKLKIKDLTNKKLSYYVKKIGGYNSFKQQITLITSELAVKIDPQVTTDIHRIFRMPGSLNSKSSLTKVRIENLDKFNPLDDACFITDKENIDISVKTPLTIKLKKKKYSISVGSNNVPVNLGVFLITKGFADMI